MKFKRFLLILVAAGALPLGYWMFAKKETIPVFRLVQSSGSQGPPALRVTAGETLFFQQAGGQKLLAGIRNNGTGMDYFQYDPASFPRSGLPYEVINEIRVAPHVPRFNDTQEDLERIHRTMLNSDGPDAEQVKNLQFIRVSREEVNGSTTEIVTYYDVNGDGWPDFKRTSAGLFRAAKVEWRRTMTAEESLKAQRLDSVKLPESPEKETPPVQTYADGPSSSLPAAEPR